MVATSPSTLAHSCDLAYLRPSSTAGGMSREMDKACSTRSQALGAGRLLLRPMDLNAPHNRCFDPQHKLGLH
jgi:hypothetical protein